MRATLFCLTFFSITFFSCTKDSSKKEVNVYIGGFRQELRNNQMVSYARYWKNGNSVNVTDGNTWIYINDMTVDNDDIYFAGHERPISGGIPTAKYWKNGIGFKLDTIQSDATSIAVANNNVYVEEYQSGNSQCLFWKNDKPTSFTYFISSLYASGDDIYIAGASSYWKNNVITTTQDPSAVFTSITASGNNIYCAGSIGNSSPSSGAGGFTTATYWINGKPYYLGLGQINSITSRGDDIYMAGYLYQEVSLGANSHFEKVATYWKNGVAFKLVENASAKAIAVDKNNDLHVIGADGNGNPMYWKNGIAIQILNSDSSDNFVSIHVN